MADLSQIPTEQLVQMLAQHQAAPSGPQQPTTTQEIAASLPARVGHGMMEPLVGAIQGIAHLTGNLSGDMSFANDFDKKLQAGHGLYQDARKATGQSGIDLGSIAGNILSPVNYAIPGMEGLGTVGKIAQGALQGGALGGLQPVYDGNYGDTKVKQVGYGAAGGAAIPAAGALLKAAKNVGVNLLGATTGAGANSIRNAYAAGEAGGEAGKSFTSAMRDPSTWDQVVTDAKGALSNLRQQRAQAYNSGMVDISKDASVLDFQPVDAAVAKSNGIKNFKGQDLSPKTAAVRQEVNDAIANWRGLDPAEYHTPEGFDALKQQLGGIKDSYQYGSPEWKVANDAYSAVRNTIADQAPTYNKVMGDYSDASDAITELEKELSLGKRGNPNTALRKLQSVMRDNANTSWGKRAQLANDLVNAGASNLMPSLAGQALSSPLPRGLAKYGDLATGLTVGAMTNGAGLPLLLAASPRAVGETAYKAGQASGALSRGATALGKLPVINRLPNIPIGALGAAAPHLLINPAVAGAH